MNTANQRPQASDREELARMVRKLATKRPGILALVALLLSGGTLLMVGVVVLLLLFGQPIYIAKTPLLEQVNTAVNNRADLRALKHLYATAPRRRLDVVSLFTGESSYYQEGTGLRRVLEDARNQQFLGTSPNPGQTQRLDQLIAEYEVTNPFDGLDTVQRQQFDSIRGKLGSEFSAVEPELNRLADALQHQTALVTRYLKDSTISFWVSITGLIFSLIVGCFQLLQARGGQINKMLAEATATMVGNLKNHADKNEDELPPSRE